MAYDGTHLALAHIGGKSNRNIFVYTTTDAASTADNASYFTDGVTRGMQVGDVVYVVQVDSVSAPTSTTAITMHAVASVSGDAATIGASSTTTTGIIVKSNGTAAPAAGDDAGDGYAIGTIWVDGTNDELYVAEAVGTAAAKWHSVNNDVVLSYPAATVATAAATLRFVAPWAGRVTKVMAVLNATSTGTAKAVTLKISGTTVATGGLSITKTQAAGTVFTASPTTGNTVAANDVVTLTTGSTAFGSITINFFIVLRKRAT